MRLRLGQVFRKADLNTINLMSTLLEYTPTRRSSAIEAMVHPFFDELRDPKALWLDTLNLGSSPKDLSSLFDFSYHGAGQI